MASPKNTRSIAVPDRVEDVFIRDHCHSSYGYEDDGKTIVLTPTLAGFAEPVETCTFLGRRQRGITSTATAALDAGIVQLSGKQVTAGLTLYKDALRFAYVAYDVDNNSVVFRIQNTAKEIRGMLDRKLQCRPSKLAFRISATALRCSFEVAVESAETVGEEERAVKGRDGAANDRDEVAQQRSRRHDLEAFGDGGGDVAQPRTCEGGPGERGKRREAAEDLGEHVVAERHQGCGFALALALVAAQGCHLSQN
jgi:hypothetical protein